MTTVSSIDRYPIDTSSDNNVWVMMRRVHFHASDMIAHRLYTRMISSADRRILDALEYARISGLEAIGVATLCAMVPVLLKPQTAASTLASLERRGLVKVAEAPKGEPNMWSLSDLGRQIRDDYGYETQETLKQVYGPPDDLAQVLVDQARLAARSMNDRLLPVLEFEAGRFRSSQPARVAPEPSSGWSALRRVHFYIDDLIFREIQPFGVGSVERRVLDLLSYSSKHGMREGLNVGTLCRLNEALNRQPVETALSNMSGLGWVFNNQNLNLSKRSPFRNRWNLTEKGNEIRGIYKRYAQITLRNIIDIDLQYSPELLKLSQRAHRMRDSRCLPVIEYHKKRMPTPSPLISGADQT